MLSDKNFISVLKTQAKLDNFEIDSDILRSSIVGQSVVATIDKTFVLKNDNNECEVYQCGNHVFLRDFMVNNQDHNFTRTDYRVL